MLLTWSQPAVEHFLEYLSEARFYNKDFPLICFSIPKRTINEHVNSLHIRNDPSSHCSCHCWSERGRGLTVSGTGVFLCGLVIMWVVCESDNTDKIRKLSRHVSYILLSCSCVSTECSKGSEMQHILCFILSLFSCLHNEISRTDEGKICSGGLNLRPHWRP